MTAYVALPLLNVLGLHSGYKLTHWIGHYASISKSDSTIDINSGDGKFFKMDSNHTTPIVSATEISSNFLRPDGKTYNLFVSPTGLLLISSN